MTALQEAEDRYKVKAKAAFDFVESRKNDEGTPAFSQDELKEFQTMNAELKDLNAGYQALKEVDEFKSDYQRKQREMSAPVNDLPTPIMGSGEQKTLARMLVEHPEYKNGIGHFNNRTVSLDFKGYEHKTLMTQAAGFAPANPRTSIVVPYATERPLIASRIPQSSTDQSSIPYMEETTFTNNAAAASEGGALGEAAIVYTQRTAVVELVGVFIPVTEQQLEDVDGMESLIGSRLDLMIALKKDDYILTGTGSTPQIRGLYNATGLQTQAKGSDSAPTAIYKAITKCRATGFAEPDICILHPNDWQDIRILQDANLNYIFGSPADPGVDTIWGKPVVTTTKATENTGLVADLGLYAHISNRRGTTITLGMQNDDFIKNQLCIKATVRFSLEVYRGAAFCTITGI